MQLTKTNFIQFLKCPESLWLLKNKPQDYPHGETSLFLEKLVQEGYEVEEYAQQLFEGGLDLSGNKNANYTSDKLKEEYQYFFQPTFVTSKGALAIIDILEKNDDGTYTIYEVKSSTSIHTDSKHNHLKDACFQKYVMTECGYTIDKVHIIYLNKEFVKNGDIDPSELLIVEDVTDKVNAIYSETVNEINGALKFINQAAQPTQCSCVKNTRSNHCDAFDYFNDIPEHSIYELNGIRAKKIHELTDLGVIDIKDVPSNVDLTERQRLQVDSLLGQAPMINKIEIKNALENLEFPLHFIDYETFPTAIPKVDGLSPHQHLTFQVSIHTMNKNGDITHFEYLSEVMELPVKMLQQMQNFTGVEGTFISWYAAFETGRNNDMMRMHPEFQPYLNYINNHMFDLEKLFFTSYVDYRFQGRTSIKYVLPILEPKFSYSELEIQNGTMALDTWGRLMLQPQSFEDAAAVRKHLLEYCKLDTLAMVKIYQQLKNL
ncbi:DUF2779 domain-containing protein [Subsaxibacter sp. CAU 1640]|uniref:DUF2779 domain-containing protein n=1 Tax=Subsaxibacter sp. CAU 1640 TaxID=2933271 RepID=UPI0020046F4B|nr:DUF2779 domain-containing protein [Subsaxibacter sp. CAU 1640]MCK7590610.1 DUF2779 domain-containing protein [Subsaxibacter sp. CAU 1640]